MPECCLAVIIIIFLEKLNANVLPFQLIAKKFRHQRCAGERVRAIPLFPFSSRFFNAKKIIREKMTLEEIATIVGIF